MSACPFCKVIAELDEDSFDDSRSVAVFEPLNPVTPGHLLFVPVTHIEHSHSRSSFEVSEAVWVASQHGHRLVTPAGGSLDFNLIVSSGPAATQTVDHIHVHFVPRRPDDGLHLPWTGQIR